MLLVLCQFHSLLHIMCVQILLGFVRLEGCLSFGIELHTRLTVHYRCILPVCYLSHFAFWFRGEEFGYNCANSWSCLGFTLFI